MWLARMARGRWTVLLVGSAGVAGLGWGRSAAAAPTPDDAGDASVDAVAASGVPSQPQDAGGAQPAPSPPTTELPPTELPREDIVEAALSPVRPSSRNAWGGYGELTLNMLGGAPGAFNLQNRGASNQPSSTPTNVVDLRRVVFFFGHDFNDELRFYSEVEFEHAVTSTSDQGEAEIEQAFLDWLPTKKLGARAGLILMPMGIVNIYHEPPSFFGVDRPDVDTVIIPTTWREAGLGIFGEPVEGLRYQLYAGTSFDAHGFNAQYGIRDGHQEAQLAYGGDLGVIGRLDYEPMLGTVVGVSAFGGTSGNSLAGTVGKVPVGLFDVDARTHLGGFTARLELAMLVIGDAESLNQHLLASWAGPGPWDGPVPNRSWGGYAEVGYNLLRWLAPASDQQVIVFDRFDFVDPQASVPAGFMAVVADRRYSDQAGLVYKPIPQIALKADYRRQYLGGGTAYDEFDSAVTWLF